MADDSNYSFAVTGLVGREGRLTLRELENPAFEHREIPITLQVSHQLFPQDGRDMKDVFDSAPEREGSSRSNSILGWETSC